MTSPLNVAILAAGQGKRMHSALPKVLHLLAGRPLIAHVLAAAQVLAPRAVAIVIGHGGDAVQAALAAPDIHFVLQDPPRGTGDATRVALEVLPADGVTLVTIADIPLVPPAALAALVREAEAGKLAVLTVHMPDPSGFGRIVRDASGAVRSIVEEKDAHPSQRAIDEINTGVMAAPTALLRRWVAALKTDNAQNEYYLTDIVALAVADGTAVVAHVTADERDVRGINDRAQLAAVERIVQQRKADALMVAGTTLADPARIDIRGTLTCGRDVRIDVGCVFEGNVSLADGVDVGPYCVLRNVAVGAGTVIGAYSHFDDAAVGANCRIGPYARLRPGAALGEEVHVGNFVEIKASTLGRGSKANHLAYIGDARVGANVNYGAGAIVANFDGANKHATVIGDNASIGSNCVLIAPVTIGEGATIGGGSTIDKDAPARELTVARAKQVTIKGWQRPARKPKPGGKV
jgi:bifunctional UDP-N-acetylglucosamine pyrophosphorylase / glucosamine-1-phosphate N-acetyltransferase